MQPGRYVRTWVTDWSLLGVWLFHCHMEWHAETGLVATMIEAPLELQRQLIPAEQLQSCPAASPENPAATVDQVPDTSRMQGKTARYVAP